MIDNKTIREVVISDKLFPGGSGEPIYENRTASGAIATFETNNTLDIVSGIFGIPYDENGYSSLNVTRCGANLWDEENEEGYIYISGNTLSYGSNASTFRSKNFIPCVGGQNYYVVCSGYSSWRLFGVDANKENPLQLAAGLDSKVVSIPSGFSFLKFYVEKGGKEYANDISINYPSTDTTYEPYTGSTYPISWTADNVYGGDVDITTGKLLSKYDSEGNLLPEPVEMSITPVAIPTLEGINNIYAVSGNATIIYKYQTGTEPTLKVNKWLPIFYPIRKGDK